MKIEGCPGAAEIAHRNAFETVPKWCPEMFLNFPRGPPEVILGLSSAPRGVLGALGVARGLRPPFSLPQSHKNFKSQAQNQGQNLETAQSIHNLR